MSASTMSVTTFTLLLMSVALSQSQGVVDPATSGTVTSSGGVTDTTLPPTPSMPNSPTQISSTQNVMNTDPNQLNLNPPVDPNMPGFFFDIINTIGNPPQLDPNSTPMDFINQGFGGFNPNSASIGPNPLSQDLGILSFPGLSKPNPGSVPPFSPGNTEPNGPTAGPSPTLQDVSNPPMPSGSSAPSVLNDPMSNSPGGSILGDPTTLSNTNTLSLLGQQAGGTNVMNLARTAIRPGSLLSSMAGATASNSRGPQGVRASGLAQLRRLIGELSVIVQQIIAVIFREFPIVRPLMPFFLQYLATGEGLMHFIFKPVTSFLSF